jgi:hypothetical protein
LSKPGPLNYLPIFLRLSQADRSRPDYNDYVRVYALKKLRYRTFCYRVASSTKEKSLFYRLNIVQIKVRSYDLFGGLPVHQTRSEVNFLRLTSSVQVHPMILGRL